MPQTAKKKFQAVEMLMHFDSGTSARETRELWINKFDHDGGDKDADPPIHPAMSPFWALHDVTLHEDAVLLTIHKYSFEVPITATAKATKQTAYCEVLKKAAVPVNVILEIPVYTNDVKVVKGSRLCLGEEADIEDE